jgi:hypothetical protein
MENKEDATTAIQFGGIGLHRVAYALTSSIIILKNGTLLFTEMVNKQPVHQIFRGDYNIQYVGENISETFFVK